MNSLDDILVIIDDLFTGNLFLMFLRSDFEQTVEELLFVIDQVGGVLVQVLLPTPDVLLKVVLHGASPLPSSPFIHPCLRS